MIGYLQIRQLHQTDAQHEKEAKEAQQMKRQLLRVDSSEDNDNAEAAAGKRRISKKLNELRRFLCTYNEGRRPGNLQGIKEKLLEEGLPYDEMVGVFYRSFFTNAKIKKQTKILYF